MFGGLGRRIVILSGSKNLLGGTTRAPVNLNLNLPRTRRRYGGLTASLLLHGLLIGLLVAHGDRLWSRTLTPGDPALLGERGGGGGGGGNRVAYITLPSIVRPVVAPAPKVTLPVPAPKTVVQPVRVPEEPKHVTSPVPDSAPPAMAGPSNARDSGTALGPGRGTGKTAGPGEGNGAGNGSGPGPSGGGARMRPPEPRDMAFPFDTPPKELRGMSLNVTFWVGVDGTVERYTVEPEIKDRDYAKKFGEVMRAFRFTPARAPDGTRIPGTTRIAFTLPGKSSS